MGWRGEVYFGRVLLMWCDGGSFIKIGVRWIRGRFRSGMGVVGRGSGCGTERQGVREIFVCLLGVWEMEMEREREKGVSVYMLVRTNESRTYIPYSTNLVTKRPSDFGREQYRANLSTLF